MNNMFFGLGKSRTPLGEWIDYNRISQGELAEWSGLGRNTVSRLCNDPDIEAHEASQIKIISTLRRRGYSVSVDDFW
jgi:predicted XRE-type DNA-binding protein